MFGPNWDWRSFDFDRDVDIVDKRLGPTLNANSTNLADFEAHGGKFLMYHGWADPLISSQDGINYFLRLALQHGASDDRNGSGDGSEIRQTQKFFRLFMVPGMGHSFGGPCPNVFGGAENPGGPTDADHNVFLALQKWVEMGTAPKQIIATKYPLDDQTQPPMMTRPLCVFPKVAHYDGVQ